MSGNTWDAAEYDSRFGFVAAYGDDVLGLMPVVSGERILDLGCGTGRHAAALADAGAVVVGVDADVRMLARAREEHPGVRFVEADATTLDLDRLGESQPFDGCFSNAALHWMRPPDVVALNVRSVLRLGGRFVAEMGGARNIAALDDALRSALSRLDLHAPVVDNYFPTIGEHASVLEAAGFRVLWCRWFERPTPLDAGSTAADWTRHFRADTWHEVPPSQHAELARLVDEEAAARGLHVDDAWHADYCRLRFEAVAA